MPKSNFYYIGILFCLLYFNMIIISSYFLCLNFTCINMFLIMINKINKW